MTEMSPEQALAILRAAVYDASAIVIRLEWRKDGGLWWHVCVDIPARDEAHKLTNHGRDFTAFVRVGVSLSDTVCEMIRAAYYYRTGKELPDALT